MYYVSLSLALSLSLSLSPSLPPSLPPSFPLSLPLPLSLCLVVAAGLPEPVGDGAAAVGEEAMVRPLCAAPRRGGGGRCGSFTFDANIQNTCQAKICNVMCALPCRSGSLHARSNLDGQGQEEKDIVYLHFRVCVRRCHAGTNRPNRRYSPGPRRNLRQRAPQGHLPVKVRDQTMTTQRKEHRKRNYESIPTWGALTVPRKRPLRPAAFQSLCAAML